MNILSFLPAVEKFKAKGGGELGGPCPRCGGEDRFIVWPEHRSGAVGGKFLCRHCFPQGGDAISFLREFQGMSYGEAREALGLPGKSEPARKVACPAGGGSWSPTPEWVPSSAWMARAGRFITECREGLRSAGGKEALALRGLSADFAARCGLGWNGRDRFELPEAWGLEPWVNDKGRPGKVSLPAGLLIPVRRRAGIVALKIRRAAWTPSDPWPKYHFVKGGSPVPLILGKPGQPSCIVESELDGLLIAQDAWDLVSAVALGSAGNKPSSEAVHFLRASPRILVALDADDAGRGAVPWWTENFPQARRLPPLRAKDINDMRAAGIPVRTWMQAGLAEYGPESAPESRFVVGMNSDKAEPAIDAQGANEGLHPAGPAFGDQTGAGDDFRGEKFFPSEFSDPIFRLMVAEGVIQ